MMFSTKELEQPKQGSETRAQKRAILIEQAVIEGRKHALWQTIHQLYLSGQSPQQIARDFPEVSVKQIHNKAAHYKWTEQRVRIQEAVYDSVEEELKELTHLIFMAAKKVLRQFINNEYIPREDYRVLITVMRLAWPNIAILPQYHERTVFVPDTAAATPTGNGNDAHPNHPLKC